MIFSEKQKEVLYWWHSSSPLKEKAGIIADGAIRSGKTLSMSLSYVLWAMMNFRERFFIIAGKTVGSCRKNVLYELFSNLKKLGLTVSEKKSENRIDIFHGEKRNTFFLYGGQDERSQDLVQGLTAAGVFFDEVALMPESFVNQCCGRCSVEGAKLWFNCNPSYPLHFFYMEWIQKAIERNLLYISFRLDDNPSLSEAKKNWYKQQFSGSFYKRNILGLWVAAEGLVYDCFNEALNTYELLPLTKKNECSCFVAIDYGTMNPFAALEIYDDGVNIYVEREYYYDGRAARKQKTDGEYLADLEKFVSFDSSPVFIIDPSAASFKTLLRGSGQIVKDADNSINDGIRKVSALFSQGRLKINKRCENLLKEIRSYSWDDNSIKKGQETPLKANDHACDALRYFVNSLDSWRFENTA